MEYLKRIILQKKLLSELNDIERNDTAETINLAYNLQWEEADVPTEQPEEAAEAADLLMMLKANLRCYRVPN